MRHLRGLLWLAAFFSVAALLAVIGAPRAGVAQSPPVEEIAPPTPVAPRFDVVGNSTCAATACHGSVRRDPRSFGALSEFIRRDEYVFFSDFDPHARSLLTLDTPRSHAMLAKLKASDNTRDHRQNCLNCHSNAAATASTGKIAIEESVSCESCHGPAGAWREKHYQRSWNPTVAAQTGFRDLTVLPVRAEQCAKCHVGAPDREVNHDLIAAGHPVLKFELAAYHDMLPKHWNDEHERQINKTFEEDLWEAGQRETIDQSLALLAARVQRQVDVQNNDETFSKRSPVTHVWPEFAEFDCFACHHTLVDASWYRPSLKEPAGLANWNQWYVANLTGSDEPAELADIKKQLDQSWRSVEPGLLKQIASTRALAGKIDFQSLATDTAATHWDDAVQTYLRLAARFRQRQDDARRMNTKWAAEPRVRQMLLDVRQDLAFEPQHDSPRPTTPGLREKIQQQLQAIEQQLTAGDR
jgi:hypothetical protein